MLIFDFFDWLADKLLSLTGAFLLMAALLVYFVMDRQYTFIELKPSSEDLQYAINFQKTALENLDHTDKYTLLPGTVITEIPGVTYSYNADSDKPKSQPSSFNAKVSFKYKDTQCVALVAMHLDLSTFRYTSRLMDLTCGNLNGLKPLMFKLTDKSLMPLGVSIYSNAFELKAVPSFGSVQVITDKDLL